MRIKQDIAAGLIFAAAGAAGLLFGREYELGSALNMGPGYLPTLLCWGLIGLGAVIAIKGAVESGAFVDHWRIRPLALVLAAVAVFALTIETAGFAIAVFATAVLASFGGNDFRLTETLALAAVLTITAVAVFVYGLSLPISVFPS